MRQLFKKYELCEKCGHLLMQHANLRNNSEYLRTHEGNAYTEEYTSISKTSLINARGELATCYLCRRNKKGCKVYT